MRRTLVAALLAGVAGAAFTTPASALPSSTAVQFGDTNAAVIQVGRKYWRNRYYDRRYSYYQPYYRSYRPYPYYRPYAYYGGYGGYPYGYYGRPGISFGFSF
jgi:hypothetical protein